MHQPPAAPYPPPPSVAPESDPNVISAVPLEIDPASVETAEIMHERKAESRHYMTPDMNDEKAVRTAMLKEIMGIREELETLNGWLEALVKKQG